MEPLRICRKCGIKGYDESGLELFKKMVRDPYGRTTICKKCSNEMARSRKWGRKARMRKLQKEKDRYAAIIATFDRPLTCHFCKEIITKLGPTRRKSLTIHSLDGNHHNWNQHNKVPAHNRCHIIYHNSHRIHKKRTTEQLKQMSLRMRGSKNPNWKGELASDRAKRVRMKA